MMIKVAIAGARGRMGSAARQAITAAPDMEVVAALDYKYDGLYLHNSIITEEREGVPFYTSLADLAADTQPDVLLDLTDPDAVFTNVKEAIALGIRPVVGTSGLSKEQIAILSRVVNWCTTWRNDCTEFLNRCCTDDEILCDGSTIFGRC